MRREPGAAPPPSERRAPQRSGRSSFLRLTGWGIGFALALLVFVGAVLLVAYFRNDPGRTPAPAAYREGACGAFLELSAGVAALERGVAENDPAASDEVRDQLTAANEALVGLPDWAPGEPFDELLASQIITLSNGADALERGGDGEEDLAIARELDDAGRRQLAEGAYGFDCGL